jgi:8-oxo-dGTP diphosphatase
LNTIEGERPQIEVAAAAICRNGKLLALRRAASQPMGGYWELPGGKVEPGESREACLRRELQEELAICIIPGNFLGCHRHSDSDKSILLCVYLVTQWAGDIELSVHDCERWLAPNLFDQVSWAPADVPHLAQIEHSLRHMPD